MSDIHVEAETLRTAAGKLETQIQAFSSAVSSFSSWGGGVHNTDWSHAAPCVEFGDTFVAAVGVYDGVLQGMLKDAQNCHDALLATAKSIEDTDATSADSFNASLAKLDDGKLSEDTAGQKHYNDHKPALQGDKPTQAPDSSPDNGMNTGPSSAAGAPSSTATTTNTSGNTQG